MIQHFTLSLGRLVLGLIIAALSLTGCQSEVARDLSDKASLRVLADLAEGEISASRYTEGKGKEARWSIIVENGFRQVALLILSRVKAFESEENTDSLNESFLGDSEGNRDNRDRKMAIALEQSLERLPGVREVRVHLALKHSRPTPSLNSLASSMQGDSAAVLITTYPKAEVDPERISQLVAGATGIPQRSIAVIVNKLPEEIFFSEIAKPSSTTAVVNPNENVPVGGNLYLRPSMIAASTISLIILIFFFRVRLRRPIKLVIDERC